MNLQYSLSTATFILLTSISFELKTFLVQTKSCHFRTTHSNITSTIKTILPELSHQRASLVNAPTTSCTASPMTAHIFSTKLKPMAAVAAISDANPKRAVPPIFHDSLAYQAFCIIGIAWYPPHLYRTSELYTTGPCRTPLFPVALTKINFNIAILFKCTSGSGLVKNNNLYYPDRSTIRSALTFL